MAGKSPVLTGKGHIGTECADPGFSEPHSFTDLFTGSPCIIPAMLISPLPPQIAVFPISPRILFTINPIPVCL